jgi:hypothetical protein
VLTDVYPVFPRWTPSRPRQPGPATGPEPGRRALPGAQIGRARLLLSYLSVRLAANKAETRSGMPSGSRSRRRASRVNRLLFFLQGPPLPMTRRSIARCCEGFATHWARRQLRYHGGCPRTSETNRPKLSARRHFRRPIRFRDFHGKRMGRRPIGHCVAKAAARESDRGPL